MSQTFAKKLKELRKKQNVTLQELATGIGSYKGTISKWENNKLEPNIEMLKRIANFFNVTVDELIDYDAYDYTFEYRHDDTKNI